MRASVLALAALVVLLALAGAAAAKTLVVEAHDAGADYWFEVEDEAGRNPAIALEPGEDVEVVLRNRGSTAHNVHFGGPIDEASAIIGPGDEATIEFVVPAEWPAGPHAYWCDLHRAQGMAGPLRLEARSDGGNATGGADDDGDAADGNATGENVTDGGLGDDAAEGADDGAVPEEAGEDTPAPAFALLLLAVLAAAARRR